MDEMYDEAAPPSAEDASVANGSNDTDNENSKGDETEDQLSLVPKHFFKGEPKPGMREMVEVVQVYEGEVSIKCVYGDDDEKKESSEEESAEHDPASMSEPEDEMMT